MKAARLMTLHPEAWVRLITLERSWGVPRQKILDLALSEHPDASPLALRDTFKEWQNHPPRLRPPGHHEA